MTASEHPRARAIRAGLLAGLATVGFGAALLGCAGNTPPLRPENPTEAIIALDRLVPVRGESPTVVATAFLRGHSSVASLVGPVGAIRELGGWEAKETEDFGTNERHLAAREFELRGERTTGQAWVLMEADGAAWVIRAWRVDPWRFWLREDGEWRVDTSAGYVLYEYLGGRPEIVEITGPPTEFRSMGRLASSNTGVLGLGGRTQRADRYLVIGPRGSAHVELHFESGGDDEWALNWWQLNGRKQSVGPITKGKSPER